MNKHLTTKQKILIALTSVLVIIGISVGTAFALRTGLGEPSTIPALPSTPTETEVVIPATTEEQNKSGDQALVHATTALSNKNKDEARKQLDAALKLYTAANNEQGIQEVKSRYSAVDSAPRPTTPTVVTPTQTQ